MPWTFTVRQRPPSSPKADRPVTQVLRSYTTIEVAKRIGVSSQTVRRWVDAGYLKAWKTLGGHRRIEAVGAELLFNEQEDRIGGAASSEAGSAAASHALAALGSLRAEVQVYTEPLDRERLLAALRAAMLSRPVLQGATS